MHELFTINEYNQCDQMDWTKKRPMFFIRRPIWSLTKKHQKGEKLLIWTNLKIHKKNLKKNWIILQFYPLRFWQIYMNFITKNIKKWQK